MPIQNEVITPEIIKEKRDIPLKMTANQIAYLSLRKEGLNQAQAAKEIGIKPSYGCQIDKRVNGKYDLTDTKLVKAAHNTVKKLIAGEPFGSIEKVKDSTALAAAQMVYDRAQPVVKISQNFNLYSFIDQPINGNEYE